MPKQNLLNILSFCLCMIFLLLLFGYLSAGATEPLYYRGSTRKMYQLTGDFDRTLRRSTRTLTQSSASVTATDLGSCFEHKGELYFLFGDTWSSSFSNMKDCWAKTSATTPEEISLEFPVIGNVCRTIEIDGVSQGVMEVPSYGISVNGNIYIVHTTDWHAPTGNMERSVLAKSQDDGLTWSLVYDFSKETYPHDMTNSHFINVSMEKIQAEDYPGQLPYSSGEVILIWGSGAYRKSNVYLACIPSAFIESKNFLRYFSGFDGDNVPQWSQMEQDSHPVVEHPVVGEFSAAWIEPVKRWVMLYNSDSPRGIVMRTAEKPWGPYANGGVIFEPWRDNGYSRFMHVPLHWARLDAFHDPGRAEEWGGEYGPYLIPRFAQGNEELCHLYYTMSTWNPYQVVLMRSTIGNPPPVSWETENLTLHPGDDGWIKSCTDFFSTFQDNNKLFISTFGSSGDLSTGVMWRWLPRDQSNLKIKFSVKGGGAEVVLLEGGGDIPTSDINIAQLYDQIKNGDYGDVIQCVWGHDSVEVSIPVTWLLTPFDSSKLKVVIIDKMVSPWGFVNVSEMVLTRKPRQTETNCWSLY